MNTLSVKDSATIRMWDEQVGSASPLRFFFSPPSLAGLSRLTSFLDSRRLAGKGGLDGEEPHVQLPPLS